MSRHSSCTQNLGWSSDSRLNWSREQPAKHFSALPNAASDFSTGILIRSLHVDDGTDLYVAGVFNRIMLIGF